MTTDRQCMAKPADRTGWMIPAAVVLLAVGSILNKCSDMEIEGRVISLERSAAGCQQGVSAPECSPGEGTTGHAQSLADQGLREAFGRLAQSVEQRTFNPLPPCTPEQPEAKLRGNPAVVDARSAPGCVGLHVDRVSGGRQEGGPCPD